LGFQEEEMRTAEEKHALIAEKVERWEWVGWGERGWMIVPVDAAAQIKTMYPKNRYSATRPDGANCLNAPNYSTDLNVCARAEAKIAKYGTDVMYKYFESLEGALSVQLWYDQDSINYDAAFLMVTAPAAARVEAMCAMIDAGVLEKA
jgi:hypothetical protein